LFEIFYLLLVQDQYIYNPSITSFTGIFFNFLILVICALVFKKEAARKKYFNYVVYISVFMSVIVILQTLLYYTTGNTISADRSFLLPFQQFFAKGVVETLQTGKWVFGTLYRPSAFFLEPAHFSQYCTIGLTYCLWEKEKLLNWQTVLISLGIITTTSGLGLACIILMWGMKIFINGDLGLHKKIARIVIVSLLGVFILGGLFMISESFQRSVLRIIIPSDGYNSAIIGRLWSISFLENLSGIDFLCGMGFKNIPTYGLNETQYYMTGIVELFYCQGMLGGCSFIILYFLMMVKSYRKKEYLPLYILIVYLPFLVCSANLVILTLIEYIPFLYIRKNYSKNTN